MAAEAAYLVGLLVFAFNAGGTAAVALVAVLRALPSVVLTPLILSLADRIPKDRLLRLVVFFRLACVAVLTGRDCPGRRPGSDLRPRRRRRDRGARCSGRCGPRSSPRWRGRRKSWSRRTWRRPPATAWPRWSDPPWLRCCSRPEARSRRRSSRARRQWSSRSPASPGLPRAGALTPQRPAPTDAGSGDPGPFGRQRRWPCSASCSRCATPASWSSASSRQRWSGACSRCSSWPRRSTSSAWASPGVGWLTAAIGLGGFVGGRRRTRARRQSQPGQRVRGRNGRLGRRDPARRGGPERRRSWSRSWRSRASARSASTSPAVSLLQRTVPAEQRGRIFGLLEGDDRCGPRDRTGRRLVLVGALGPSAAIVVGGAHAARGRRGRAGRSSGRRTRRRSSPEPALRLLSGVAIVPAAPARDDRALAAERRDESWPRPGEDDHHARAMPGRTLLHRRDRGGSRPSVDGRQTGRAGSGDSFGEIALVRDMPVGPRRSGRRAERHWWSSTAAVRDRRDEPQREHRRPTPSRGEAREHLR